MREVHYKVHWSYGSRGSKRKAPLAEFILDIPYFMAGNGVIPPLHVLNEVLLQGGDDGGMGPGATWELFSIGESEYHELVEALQNLDVTAIKKKHPYVSFESVIVDEMLHQSSSYGDWLKRVSAKYRTA